MKSSPFSTSGLLLLILIAGACLRLDQFFAQVLSNAELQLLPAGVLPANVLHGATDNLSPANIAMGRFYSAVLQVATLSEWQLRLPHAAASIATLCWLSLFWARREGSLYATVLAVGLAFSLPLAVAGHTADGSSILVFLQVAALLTWYGGGSKVAGRRLVAYLTFVALAAVLDPMSLIATSAPLLLFLSTKPLRDVELPIKTLACGAWLLLAACVSVGFFNSQLFAESLTALAGLSAPPLVLPWVLVVACVGIWGMGKYALILSPLLLQLGALSVFAGLGLLDSPSRLQQLLLPLIPTVWLLFALGSRQVFGLVQSSNNRALHLLPALGWALGFVCYVAPLWTAVQVPNSYWAAGTWRAEADNLPASNSPFWSTFTGAEGRPNLLVIAPLNGGLAPAALASLEQSTRQRIWPASLSSLCGSQTNVSETSSSPQNLQLRTRYAVGESPQYFPGVKPDWLIYLGGGTGRANLPDRELRRQSGVCLQALRDRFGKPAYRDEYLAAYRLTSR